MTVGKEISKYKLDLVGVQEVGWDRGGTELAGQYTFFCRKENENHELGTGSFYIRESCQQSVSDRMSHIILGGRWCNIIVLNVHTPTEIKIVNT
jgi:hypothetical protein